MQLYAVGNGGNGNGATPLIKSTVKSVNGGFTITGDYTCPADINGQGVPVYLTATGGNPGLSTANGPVNNTALAMVSALGSCDTLYANAATTTLNINEVTTAAAAWALAPFATSLTNIASSSTNMQGITNAMLTAQQLADPTTGSSPGSSAPMGSVMESAKLNTLADILASCVNSNGTDTNCSGLFTDITPMGGTKPSDTFGAALMMVKNPGYNVANIYMNHRRHIAALHRAQLCSERLYDEHQLRLPGCLLTQCRSAGQLHDGRHRLQRKPRGHRQLRQQPDPCLLQPPVLADAERVHLSGRQRLLLRRSDGRRRLCHRLLRGTSGWIPCMS